MAEKKITTKKVTKVKETDKAIIFKANRPLMKEEFELLSDLVKLEEKKTGLKIILMPYSCEVVENATRC
jgi:hypothetical protein